MVDAVYWLHNGFRPKVGGHLAVIYIHHVN